MFPFLNKNKKKDKIPQTNADSIPYIDVYKNDIIEIREGVFSKSYRLPPMNFKTASTDAQQRTAEAYSAFMGSFPDDVTREITIYNQTVDIMEFQKDVLIPMCADNLNNYREEYNDMLLEKMAGAKNNLQAVKYLTLSVPASDIEKASERFAQLDQDVREGITQLTKHAPHVSTYMERLELLNAIYHQDAAVPLYQKRTIQGHEVESFTLDNCKAQGITTKDVIAADGYRVEPDYLVLRNTYARSYYISNYPTWVKGTFLTDFASLPKNMLVSAYFNSIPQDEAVQMIKNKSTNISSSIVDTQKRAARSGFDASLISPELQDAKAESMDLMDNMTKENSKIFVANIVITVFDTSKEGLDESERYLRTIASKHLATIKSLTNQQETGFNTALPLANNMLDIQRLMTSITISALIPFDVKEVRQKTGMYYGLNASSRNMILYDRTTEANPNGCILGMPGAGKSFAAKREMVNVLLNTEDEVYVIDPEGIDYTPLANAMGGSVVKLAAGTKTYVNPFDLNIDNHDDNGDPVKVKTDFIEAICNIAIGGRLGLSPIEKSIIDRCVSKIYEPYLKHLNETGKKIDVSAAPTMNDFYNQLLMEPYTEANNLALSLERYVKGSLDIFAHSTNIEINNRFTVYNIRDIGPGLKELGLQICLDNIWNKMIENKENGKRTWIYIDEFHMIMQNKTSANYISQIWKRARKWNGVPTAITQNVEDMLKSEDARTVINNCTFIILLGQTPMNKQQLSDLLDISLEEQKYISTAKPGMGLIRIVNDIIPMDDNFPKNSLYKLMTTRPDETKP